MEPTNSPVFQINEEGQEAKYFLRGQDDNPSGHSEDVQISEGQFRAIINYGTAANSGDLSEAEILRLHQEQDPASPLFKGSQPAGTNLPGTAAEDPEPASAYYEPSGDKIDAIAETIPDSQGTTTITTEEATIPPVIEEPVIEPEAVEEIPEQPVSSEPAEEQEPETTEDAGTPGA